MGRLEGRVAIVTGAGRGLGRAHALCLAAEGAAVVVNDVGAELDGTGRTLTPAEEVVAHIRGGGGRAAASGHDISDWADAGRLVEFAVSTFGGLHVLVNNAGILRDRHPSSNVRNSLTPRIGTKSIGQHASQRIWGTWLTSCPMLRALWEWALRG